MIRGLGCDVCAIPRMRKIIENPRFLERWFTAEERAYINAHNRRAETAAGIFAAKEAFVKALGTGFSGFSMADISIEPDELGRPVSRLSGGALERLEALGGKRMLISITHAGGFASAVAVLEG